MDGAQNGSSGVRVPAAPVAETGEPSSGLPIVLSCLVLSVSVSAQGTSRPSMLEVGACDVCEDEGTYLHTARECAAAVHGTSTSEVLGR